VAAVIASAVIPTLIANAWFMPRHLLPKAEAVEAVEGGETIAVTGSTKRS